MPPGALSSMVSNGPMNDQRRPRPSFDGVVEVLGRDVALADQPKRLGQQRALQPVQDEAVDLAVDVDRHLADLAIDRRARASIASGEVHGAPQSSTSGTRCGGLTGMADEAARAARQRLR